MSELIDLVSKVVQEFFKLLILWDVSIDAETLLSGAAQHFMAIMTTIDLFKLTPALTEIRQALDLVF